MSAPLGRDHPDCKRHMANDPVLIAYHARRTKSGRAAWTRIGRAYPHETGAGLTVILDFFPRDGRIILLELDDDDDERLLREAAKRHPAQSPKTDKTD